MPTPGVVVTTATRSGPASPSGASSGQYFLAGLAERGSVTRPVRVRSLAEYIAQFGNRVTYSAMYDDIQTFFEEGGAQAWVTRVVGPAALLAGGLGTLTLSDRATTPVATLRVDAANPGAWSTRLTIETAAGTITGTYRLILRFDGNIVFDANNLATPGDAVSRFAGNQWVTVTDLGSASAPPTNIPAVRAATPLAAGTDDRAAVTAAMLVSALDRFDIGFGDGSVAIPGQGTAVHAGLAAHAKATRRIAILSAARGAAIGDAATAGTLVNAAANVNSEYAGLFAPWVLVPDGAGGTRAIGPEGFVAAQRAAAHRSVGPWRAPAGIEGIAAYVIGVDQGFTRTDHDLLDAGRVSPIRVISNSVRLYGWRSLSQDEQNYSMLTGRDVLNRLTVECEARLEPFVFQTIDGRGQLLSAMNGVLRGVLEPIRSQGGIFERRAENGDILDVGYTVDTGPGVNSIDVLANNEVRARVAVRISPTAALVSLTIVKVGVTAAV